MSFDTNAYVDVGGFDTSAYTDERKMRSIPQMGQELLKMGGEVIHAPESIVQGAMNLPKSQLFQNPRQEIPAMAGQFLAAPVLDTAQIAVNTARPLLNPAIDTGRSIYDFMGGREIPKGMDYNTIPEMGQIMPPQTGTQAAARLLGDFLAPSVAGKIGNKMLSFDKWLVKTYSGGVNEKLGNYTLKHPEIVLKPETILSKTTDKVEPIEDYPALWQQTYHKAYDAFRAEKDAVGKTVGLYKKYAREHSDDIQTTAKDLVSEAESMLASKMYGKPNSPANMLLKDIIESLSYGETKTTGTKLLQGPNGLLTPTKVTTTKIPDKLGFEDAEKTLLAVTNSRAWKHTQETAKNNIGALTSGEKAALELVSAFRKRVNSLVDSIETGLEKDGAKIARGRYTAIKNLEYEIGASSPKDFESGLIKSSAVGNEDLFDALASILPEDVFKTAMATIVNMPTKSLDKATFGMSPSGPFMYNLIRAGAKNVEAPFAKIAAGELGAKPPYNPTKLDKFFVNTGKAKAGFGQYVYGSSRFAPAANINQGGNE